MSEPPSFALLLAAFQTEIIPQSSSVTFVIWRVLLALGLLLLSGMFFAGLSAVTNLIKHNHDDDPEVKYLPLLKRPEHAVISLQLGRALSTFSYAVIAVMTLYSLFNAAFVNVFAGGTWALILAFLIAAYLYVLIVMQLVSVSAESFPVRTLKLLHFPLRVWQVMTYPLTLLVRQLTQPLIDAIIARTPPPERQQTLKRLLHESLNSSALDEHERLLLKNVFEFSESVAHDLMVPRPDVVWVSVEQELKQVLEVVSTSGHTRFPLCEKGPDSVIGYLHAKDLAFLQGTYLPAQVDLRQLVRPVAFVPGAARAMTLLERFQEERSHMAVVVDEFGGMSGIITLEDLLEELVGEIRDEFDVEEPEVKTLASGDVIVDGGVRLDDLECDLGVSFGEVEEDTIGGFVFGRLAREVMQGDSVDISGAKLVVEAVEGLRVTQVRIVMPLRQDEQLQDASQLQERPAFQPQFLSGESNLVLAINDLRIKK